MSFEVLAFLPLWIAMNCKPFIESYLFNCNETHIIVLCVFQMNLIFTALKPCVSCSCFGWKTWVMNEKLFSIITRLLSKFPFFQSNAVFKLHHSPEKRVNKAIALEILWYHNLRSWHLDEPVKWALNVLKYDQKNTSIFWSYPGPDM